MTLKTTLTSRLGMAVLLCGAAYGAAKESTTFKAPAAFEPNRGQTAKQFDYLAKGFGYSIGIAPTHTEVAFGPATAVHRVSLEFAGAHVGKGQALDPLDFTSSYFYGDRSITKIPTFERVRYANLYNGIDVVYYGNNDKLEYDLVVAPGADPRVIQLHFQGADAVTRSPEGDLVLNHGESQMLQRKPLAYQMSGAERKEVAASYALDGGGKVHFELGDYDRGKELVIDPILLFQAYGRNSTFTFSGNGSVNGTAVTTDNLGNFIYLAGTSTPIADNNTPIQSTANNIYVERFDNNGTRKTKGDSALIGLTSALANFYGTGVALDSDNNVYLTGYTDDTRAGGLGSPSGGQDAILSVIDSTFSSLKFSRYFGGSGNDRATGIAVDQNTQGAGGPSTGIVYVVGTSTSANFPAGAPSGPQHGFVYAINTKTNTVLYSRALGGSGTDAASGVAVDLSNNVFVGGSTTSADFSPVVPGSGYVTVKTNNNNDGYVVKVNAAGAATWTTFYPNGPINAITQLTCAVSNCGTNGTFAYVTGTTSGAINTLGTAYQPTSPGGGGVNHAFFAKFDTNSTALSYSSYLGGASVEAGLGIAVQTQTGIAMIVGSTTSTNFATTAPGIYATSLLQNTFNGPVDGFISYINPAVAGVPGLAYSTYRGSNFDSAGSHAFVSLTGIATDFYGEAAISGTVSDALAPNFGGGHSTGLAFKLGSAIWVPTTYVTQLYADFLDRNPDPSGLNFWVGVLNTQSRPAVAVSFANSQEFNQWGLQIVKDYLGILNRIPDYSGYKNNFDIALAAPNDPTSVTNKIAQIQTTMMASPEFQNLYPSSLSLQAYITQAFNNVLLRNPTPTELNQNLGSTRNQIMINLIAGSEFNNRIFAPAYGNLMYLAILRRGALDPTGLAFWTGVLANPNLLQTVIQNFSTSQEYFNRFQ